MYLRTITGLLLGFILAPRPTAAQQLEVPRESPADTSFSVRVEGLSPHELATLSASTVDSAGRSWESRALFRAQERGYVDTATDAPIEGSYVGARPLGLITAMDLAGESAGRERFRPGRLDSISAHFRLEIEGSMADSATVVLRLLDSEVTVVPLEGRDWVGLYHVPPGQGPFPGALVIGGSEGGIGGREEAAFLARRGIAALAIAYFGAEGLPTSLREIPLEAFTAAIDSILARPEANGAVAMVGTSKGAEAALLVAARDPRIRAVVAYAPSHVAWSCICDEPQRSSWSWRGQPVSAVPPGRDPEYSPAAGAPLRPAIHYVYRLRDRDAANAALIEVERFDGPILLVAGDQDGLWPSAMMARAIMERRGNATGDVLLVYPEAGHLIGKACELWLGEQTQSNRLKS